MAHCESLSARLGQIGSSHVNVHAYSEPFVNIGLGVIRFSNLKAHTEQDNNLKFYGEENI